MSDHETHAVTITIEELKRLRAEIRQKDEEIERLNHEKQVRDESIHAALADVGCLAFDAAYVIRAFKNDNDQLKSCERSMAVAIEMALERIEEPPEANCSCHLSPPCNDCVEFGGAREAFDEMRAALKSYTNRHEVMNPPASAARGAEARNLTSANVMGLGEVHRASEARPADDVPAPVRIATLQNEIRQIENHCHSYKLVADGSYEQCIYEMGHSQKTKELNALQYSSKPLGGERSLTPEQEARGISNLFDAVIESQRLQKLTNEQLVDECANSEVADYELGCELMNRVHPGWFNKEPEKLGGSES